VLAVVSSDIRAVKRLLIGILHFLTAI